MKITTVLLFTAVVLLFSVAYSKSVREIFDTEDIADDYGIEENQADVQKRGYYWIVSAWSPCKCHDGMATGIQYRNVSCTKQPCHFIRAPRFKQVCQCH
ncbi:hypothetical protein OS493_023444 [Desmophyllum pertusum]|uniref:Uncharacterized protein n=1 Tax=Desmophyllum pertusum TaxID=174260 RepID=A0A9X0D438_9CNID|nr:hypothetical protein OS493_023444 [Desmophyllum pertusum]